MSEYKSVIKSNVQSIDGSRIKKRDVKVTCVNNNAGKAVAAAINQNSNALTGGYAMNKISTGVTSKDFTVKFSTRDGAQYFYNKLKAIMNDSSVPVVETEKSGLDQMKEKAGGIIDSVTSAFLPVADEEDGLLESQGEETAAAHGEDNGDGGGGNKNTIIIAAAAAVVLLLVVVLVMKKK